MKRLAKDTVTPFGQSKPPIYLRRARRESLPARWPARARDGLVSGNRVNLLERYDYPAQRELIIPFGSTGYVALYEIVSTSKIVVLAVRHQREEDYH